MELGTKLIILLAINSLAPVEIIACPRDNIPKIITRIDHSTDSQASLGLIHFDRYDWCPNVVIWALHDGIPVICSNYGGTPEITKKRGIILQEFPEALPASLEGINFVKKMKFPSELFIENLLFFNKSVIKKSSDKRFSMKQTAIKYINYMNQVLYKI